MCVCISVDVLPVGLPSGLLLDVMPFSCILLPEADVPLVFYRRDTPEDEAVG
jgi:hypothetical protein